MDNLVKVFFRLQPDEDGWPPVSVESVWAKPGMGANEYIIENVPFFTRDATADDTVQVRIEEGCRWFDKLVQGSTNSLIRIIVSDLGAIEEIANHLIALGCDTELAKNFKLIAVNVPASVKLSDVQKYIQEAAGADTLDYEEAILRQPF